MAFPIWDRTKTSCQIGYRKFPGAPVRRWKGHTFYSPSEAAEAVLKVEREFEKGRGERLTATDATAALDEFMASRQVTEDTKDFYERKIRPFFVRQGSKPMGEWEPLDLEAHLKESVNQGDSTKAGVVKALRVFSNWARKRRRYKVSDFAAVVEVPRYERKERRPRTVEEAQLIVAKAKEEGHYLYLPLMLAWHAGLSLHDIYDLTADQVDLAGGWIRRRRCKTGYGDPIPITEPLRAALVEAAVVSGPVCRGMPGREKRRDNGNLAALERRAGVVHRKGDGFHALRHLGISQVYRAGGMPAARRFAQHAPTSHITYGYVHNESDETYRAAVEAAARAGG